MSGPEFIIGATLASIPIALEAYDRSGRVFEIFRTFKRFPREVGLLEAKLNSQKTTFRNNTINLLCVITKDRAKVEQVMKTPSSPAATRGLKIAASYKLELDSLDESFQSCRQTAEVVSATLQELCSQFETFRSGLSQWDESMPQSSWIPWAKNVKTRFKLGLDKPKIGKAIDELRNLNADYDLITRQIIQSLQGITDQQHPVQSRVFQRRTPIIDMDKYRRSRYASRDLHSTLRLHWVCSSYRHHVFDIRLVDDEVSTVSAPTGRSVLSYVTCELNVTHDGSSHPLQGHLRLQVEQACELDADNGADLTQSWNQNTNLHKLAPVLEGNTGRLEVEARPERTSTLRRLSKRLKGEEPAPSAHSDAPMSTQLQELAPPTLSIAGAATTQSPDLSKITDFCEQSQKVMDENDGRALLGSWQIPEARWFCVPQTPPGTFQSLADMMEWIAEEPILRALPRVVRLQLAGDVAEGLMSFYSTPWLPSASLGRSVRYIQLETASTANTASPEPELKGPYFINGTQGSQQVLETGVTSKSEGQIQGTNFSGARNQLLFNFGILLLEIGFGQPWHKLKEMVSRREAGSRSPSDYLVAEKLANLLVRQMGLAYPRIIKMCLGCDFGLGETDLDKEDLQERFVDEVVMGLQRLKEAMTEMGRVAAG